MTHQRFVMIGPAGHGMNFWTDPVACETITCTIGLNPNAPPNEAAMDVPAHLVAVVTRAGNEIAAGVAMARNPA